eukprot:TRINITY_DN31335_c0_g1_i1.p1 TRINITY_DN31335_c0_g1~~TRINITY_DN31335_c0_g1_i1.p1  ORF type:complete len:565 (-),score=58.77 TRINITY_DN31335_c0_g1_i1:140-1639(-)
MIDYREFITWLGDGISKSDGRTVTLGMWKESLVWQYSLQPSQRVSQMIVGPYSAFMLLDDGTPWRIGPVSCDDDSPLAEPQKLTALHNACGGRVLRLGLDYLTLFAVAGSGDVWAESRPGEESSCWLTAAMFLCEGDSDTCDGSDADDDRDNRPRKAVRLSGKNVIDITGSQNVGIVVTSTGPSLLYCSRDTSGQWELECPTCMLLQLDFGDDRRVMKAVMDYAPPSGPFFVLDDGSVAHIDPYDVKLAGDVVSVPVLPDLEEIINLSFDGSVAIDRSGMLWRTDKPGVRIINQGACAERLCGLAVAVAVPGDREEPHLLGDYLALPWDAMGPVGALGFVGKTRYDYTIGYVYDGKLPEGAPEYEVLTPGANLLACLFGCDKDIRLGENKLPGGIDLERMKNMLQDWGYPTEYAPDCASGYGIDNFLYAFASMGVDGCRAAVRLLLDSGVGEEAVNAAVGKCVEDGDKDTLAILRDEGCLVSDEQWSKCEALYAEDNED